jgi:hypothetical protein
MVFRFHFTTMRSDTRSMTVSRLVFSIDDNRPIHVSSRDSPQSLEFWEDGRRSFPDRVLAYGRRL